LQVFLTKKTIIDKKTFLEKGITKARIEKIPAI